MALKDEIKAARKDLVENGTLKEKIAYFFEYYTLHTIIISVILIFAISFIYEQLTKPDILLNGIVLNVFDYENINPVGDMANGFIEHLGVDGKKNEVSFNSSLTYNMGGSAKQDYSDYEVSQIILTQCAAGSVDFISSPLSAIENLGYNELFVSLEDVLTEEELERYEPYFLYVDLAVINLKNEAAENDQNPDSIPCPDPTKPEEMKEPIPVFIDVTSSEKMVNIYSYSSDTLAMGVAVNAPNPDRISDFLAYLFEK